MALWKKREPPLDPFERAARRVDPELATLEQVEDLGGLAALRPRNLLMLFLGLVLVVAIVRDGIGGRSPTVTRSCEKPAYTLSGDSVRPFGVLRWSATGPSGSRVVFGIDTTTAPTDGDALLAGPVELEDCLARGQFGVRADPGEHVVSVYLLDPDGGSSLVGTKKVTVSDR